MIYRPRELNCFKPVQSISTYISISIEFSGFHISALFKGGSLSLPDTQTYTAVVRGYLSCPIGSVWCKNYCDSRLTPEWFARLCSMTRTINLKSKLEVPKLVSVLCKNWALHRSNIRILSTIRGTHGLKSNRPNSRKSAVLANRSSKPMKFLSCESQSHYEGAIRDLVPLLTADSQASPPAKPRSDEPVPR